MAKKRKGKKKGRGSGSEAPAEDRPQPREEQAPPIAPPRDAPPAAIWVAAALLAVLGLVASAPEGAPHEALWDLGRILAVLAAGGLATLNWRRDSSAAVWLAGATALLGIGTLMALYGRNPAVSASPFGLAYDGFAGFPSALPFLAIAVACRVLRRDPERELGLGLLVVGVIWGTAVLFMPHYELGEMSLPLGLGLDALQADDMGRLLAGLVICLGMLPVGAGWAIAFAATRRRSLRESLAATRWLLEGGAWLIVGYHVLVPLVSDAPALPALLIAATLIVTAAAAEQTARLWKPAEADPRALGRVERLASWGPPLVILSLYFLLKTHGMVPSNTDENIYFYMAADLGHGRVPYVDYFFAHPPLHVLVPGAAFTLFGYSLTFAKLFSVAAGGIAGLAVWAIGRRHFGRVAAAFAMVAFLFAAEVLKATTNMTGVNLTVMWLMLGMWQSLKGNPRAAGLLMGAAATTGFYSMGPICALLLLGFFRRPEDPAGHRGPQKERFTFGVRQLFAFGAFFGGVNLLFYTLAGDAFVDGVYEYHGLKRFQDAAMVPLTGGDKGLLSALVHNMGVMVDGKTFTKEVYYHAHLWITLFVAPALGAVAYFTRPEGRAKPWRFLDPRRFWHDGAHGAAALVWLTALALFIQFSMFRELYSFYFTLIYPVLGLLVGYCIVHPVWLAAGAVARAAADHLPTLRLTAAAILITSFAMWRPWSEGVQDVFPDEVRNRGEVNQYEWTDAPVLPGLSGVVRTLFWADSRRKGDSEPGYRYYLWTKKRGFESLDRVAAWISEHSTPDETIAGASTMAPLVALASGRRLAAGEADTNTKRFKTGMLEEEAYWNAICADNVRYLVSISRSYFHPRRLQQMPTVRRWFRPVKTFMDTQLRYGGTFPIIIWERVGEPPGEGRVCQFEKPAAHKAPARGNRGKRKRKR